MKKTNKTKVEEFIRVDHAGERGAIKIYEGQLLALKTFKQNEDSPIKTNRRIICPISTPILKPNKALNIFDWLNSELNKNTPKPKPWINPNKLVIIILKIP